MDKHQIDFKKQFQDSSRPHALMITNHGIHQWKIIPGLPDTGGQNVFVNQLTESLTKIGYKITIVNRGGYEHPISGEPRHGLHYKDENQRILYLEDDRNTFIRKEEMEERIPSLAEALNKHLKATESTIDLIISHYWDGAKLGMLYNKMQNDQIKHIWVPHSLGEIKKRNVKPEQWANLRIDERIRIEKEIIQSVNGIAATSSIIKQSLKEDYQYDKDPLFLPPCVDPERYHPREISSDDPIWAFLSRHCSLTENEIRDSQIITEISRTDGTKRKDILIKAFAGILGKHPKALLVITIDNSNESLSKSLLDLIRSLNIEKRVAVLGSVWDELPKIYSVTDIYCTPSIMEGFGMTSQEAAATRVPVIASHLVPFATEYLLGDHVEQVFFEGSEHPLKVGQGAIVVKADEINGFAHALDMLLLNPDMRQQLGEAAYNITIPYFTWDNMVREFISNVNTI